VGRPIRPSVSGSLVRSTSPGSEDSDDQSDRELRDAGNECHPDGDDRHDHEHDAEQPSLWARAVEAGEEGVEAVGRVIPGRRRVPGSTPAKYASRAW